jgi:threonine synthase
MFTLGFRCVSCKTVFPLRSEFFICPKCGLQKIKGISVIRGITEVEYDYDALATRISKEQFAKRPFSLWRYRELLGFGAEDAVVTIGEGGTPLVKCRRLADALGIKNLWLKNETQNPTHSFKDRESVLAVTRALEEHATRVSCVSSGNAAASLAAYAARAGLECFVLTPATAPEPKIHQCAVYGAKTLLVNGLYEDIFEPYIEAVRGLEIGECSSGHNRFRAEGDKTIAYEICEQLGWRSPGWVVDNVGNGTHLYGIWKGFRELTRLGLIRDLPRMAAAGPLGGSPIVEGFKEGTALPLTSCRKSIADALVSRWCYDASLALSALKESSGHAEYVSDNEILEAMKLLASLEGIFAEPSGAASIACLRKMLRTGVVDSREDIVCVITGSGLKEPKSSRRISRNPIHVRLSTAAIKSALERGKSK